MSLLGMTVDWFVLKLVNCLRKTCGCSMRQPLRGGEQGPRLPPSTGGNLAGPVEIVAQIQTHRPITWNDTFIGVSWGKRLMVTELGPGPTRSGFQPPDGQWAFLL